MRYSLLLLAAATLSACASPLVQTTPQWDSRFGVDTRLVLAQQIKHRAAGRNPDPVDGMDGRSALSAYERYQKAGVEQAKSVLNSGVK